MDKVLVTLVMSKRLTQAVEDLLLSCDLVSGFTTSSADGHGITVELIDTGEQVAGHAARTIIRMVGSESDMRGVLAIIKEQLPNANMFFWMTPLIDMGHL
ncbi:MAG: DUF3240 family protein [Azonexus sp.]|jgi:hypothetical protein|nr:DUF3240 family protein [Azonexus sp.]